MAKVKTTTSTGTAKKERPPLSPEAWESRMTSKAYKLVEKRLDEGTASSQETTHFLKMGTREYQLKIQQLEEENKLLRAKTEAIESQKRVEELYAEALSAMRGYAGMGGGSNDDY